MTDSCTVKGWGGGGGGGGCCGGEDKVGVNVEKILVICPASCSLPRCAGIM